jgi:formylglycine-generating enzyme required for sulfatase activity
VSLPAGQSWQIPVQVERQHCRGPIELRLEDAPAGVQLKAGLIPDGADAAKLELAVAEQAAPANRLVRLVAIAADAKAETTFRLAIRSAEITNSIGMKLVRIPPGKFLMGSPIEEVGRFDHEDEHEVAITQPFYLGVYEVTQQEYEEVMGKNPSWFSPKGGGKDKVKGMASRSRQFPVENVSWEEVVEFCRKLSERTEERRTGRTYRLPTEAEWEYACRGGARETTPFHFGPTLSPDQANISSRLGRTTVVGSYKPNAFGLYDMHGNIWEWCQDWHDEDYYKRSPPRDPPGPEKGRHRVLRGGAWSSDPRDCRAASRDRDAPGSRDDVIGFRVVCLLGAKTP